MEYRFEKNDAGRGSQTAIVLFAEKEYELLTDFFGSDVYSYYGVLSKLFSKAFSDANCEETFIGNQCGLKIRKDKTEVFDTFDENIFDSLIEVDTVELWDVIQDFMQYIKENHLYYE